MIDAQCEFIGVATVDVDLSRIQELVRLDKEDQFEFMLLSKLGIIISHKNLSLLGQPLPKNGVWSQSLADVKNGLLKDDKQFYLAYAPINSTHWDFIIQINEQRLLLDFSRQKNLQIALLVLALLISMIVAFVFSGKITKPLTGLTRAAQRITEGNYDIQISTDKLDDEVGLLSRSFNVMTHKLVEREQRLKQTNNELEQRVKQRTEKLARSEENLSNAP